MTCRAVVVVFLFLASLCIPSRAHGQEREGDPSPAAAPPPKKETKAPEEKKHQELELGALGGVGFPHPLAIEGVVRVHERVMLGVEYGVMPKITISDVSTSMWSLAADARVFPFKGAFFIGLRAGYQSLSAAATLTADNIGSYTESMDVKTWFLNRASASSGYGSPSPSASTRASSYQSRRRYRARPSSPSRPRRSIRKSPAPRTRWARRRSRRSISCESA